MVGSTVSLIILNTRRAAGRPKHLLSNHTRYARLGDITWVLVTFDFFVLVLLAPAVVSAIRNRLLLDGVIQGSLTLHNHATHIVAT